MLRSLLRYAAAIRVLISLLTRSRAMRIFSIGDLPAISLTPAASEGFGMFGIVRRDAGAKFGMPAGDRMRSLVLLFPLRRF